MVFIIFFLTERRILACCLPSLGKLSEIGNSARHAVLCITEKPAVPVNWTGVFLLQRRIPFEVRDGTPSSKAKLLSKIDFFFFVVALNCPHNVGVAKRAGYRNGEKETHSFASSLSFQRVWEDLVGRARSKTTQLLIFAPLVALLDT